MGLFDDEQVELLFHWIHYRGYYNFDDMYDTFCHNPEYVHKCKDYKWNGLKDCINPYIAQKVKSFIKRMNMKDDIIYDMTIFLSLRQEKITWSSEKWALNQCQIQDHPILSNLNP